MSCRTAVLMLTFAYLALKWVCLQHLKDEASRPGEVNTTAINKLDQPKWMEKSPRLWGDFKCQMLRGIWTLISTGL